MDKILTAKNITKYFHNNCIVNNISFEVMRKDIIGILGPDGAGKTTLMRILTGVYGRFNGQIQLFGESKVDSAVRKRIGYVPQKFSLYENLSVLENMELVSALYGIISAEKIQNMLEITSLWEFKHRLAGKLSGGMKQKLALAAAVIHEPEILFLDEPTTGVDPVSRREFWQLLYALNQKDLTIIVSTPYMDEAELCRKLMFIYHGQSLFYDSIEKITECYPYTVFESEVGLIGSADKLGGFYCLSKEQINDAYKFITDDAERTRKELLKKFPQAKIREINPALEDAFIWMMEKGEANG